MNDLRVFCVALGMVLFLTAFSNEISVNYHLMDQDEFQNVVVGNTVVGVTRQSHSLYMLYFLPNGYCELWKQNQIYLGNWWIEKDKLGRDCVRAFWPQYTSSEPDSLFSPKNPRYGTPTALKYYFDSQRRALLVAGNTLEASVIFVPGCPFHID